MAKSYSTTSVTNETESVTFGEGAQSSFIGRGATITTTNTGLQGEEVAALTSSVTGGIADVVKSGYSALSDIVGKLQTGTEESISAVEQAYAKSTSGTAGIESVKPFIFGAIGLAAVALLSTTRGRR